MRTFTEEQIKKLKKNPYTFKLTKNKLYFTAKFKEDFWISYQAASGRTSGHESSTSPGYQVTRDADGNIIRKSGSSDNSGGFTSNHGTAEGISRFVTGKSSGTSQGGLSGGINLGDMSGGAGKSGGVGDSYVSAPNQGGSSGVSQKGQRGPQGDFRH